METHNITGWNNPTHGIVNQVVGMIEKSCGDVQRVVILMVSCQCDGGDNGYALFPKILALGQCVKDFTAWHTAVFQRTGAFHFGSSVHGPQNKTHAFPWYIQLNVVILRCNLFTEQIDE